MNYIFYYSLSGIIFIPEIQITFCKIIKLINARCRIFLSELKNNLIDCCFLFLGAFFSFLNYIHINRLTIICFLPDTLRLTYHVYAFIKWSIISEVDNEYVVMCNMLPSNKAEIDDAIEENAKYFKENFKIGVIDLPKFAKENCPEDKAALDFLYNKDEENNKYTFLKIKNLKSLENKGIFSVSDFQNLQLTAHYHPVLISKFQNHSSNILCYSMTTSPQPIISYNEKLDTMNWYITVENLVTQLKILAEKDSEAFSKVFEEIRYSTNDLDFLDRLSKNDKKLYDKILAFNGLSDDFFIQRTCKPFFRTTSAIPHDVSTNTIAGKSVSGMQIHTNLNQINNLPHFQGPQFKVLEGSSVFFQHMTKAYYPAGSILSNGTKSLQLIDCCSISLPKDIIDTESQKVAFYNFKFETNFTDRGTQEHFYNRFKIVELFNSTTSTPNSLSSEYWKYIIKTINRFSLKNFK